MRGSRERSWFADFENWGWKTNRPLPQLSKIQFTNKNLEVCKWSLLLYDLLPKSTLYVWIQAPCKNGKARLTNRLKPQRLSLKVWKRFKHQTLGWLRRISRPWIKVIRGRLQLSSTWTSKSTRWRSTQIRKTTRSLRQPLSTWPKFWRNPIL